MEVFVLQFASGLLKANILFLLAVGLTLIFGVIRVMNLAHGTFYMLGAYLAYSVVKFLGNEPSAFWIALLIAPVVVAIAGGLVEIILLRRVYGAGELFEALLTFAIILIMDQSIRIIWGPNQLNVARPAGFEGAVSLGGVLLPSYNLLLLGLCVLIGVGLWLLIFRTRFGLLMRAAAHDREMLGCLGVNVPRIYTLTFGLGIWLAGVAGALIAPLVSLDTSMGVNIIIETFSVVVIGGLGSIMGTVVSSLLIGQVESFGILIWSEIALPLVFLIMAIVLVIRPQGLFGRSAER